MTNGKRRLHGCAASSLVNPQTSHKLHPERYLNVDSISKNKNALLPGETHFLDLSVLSYKHGVIVGFRVTIFPAAFALRDDRLSFLHRRFGAVDQQAVFTGLQVDFADFGGLRDVDGLADRLTKQRHR